MKQLTEKQAITISAFTGVLCCDFGAFHSAVEGRLGYPVFTHQFGDKEFAEKIKEAFREDFISLIPKELSE